jgi:hypothetical protein
VCLVSRDLALSVVLEVPVPLEAALDDLPELVRERIVVEEVVHAQT